MITERLLSFGFVLAFAAIIIVKALQARMGRTPPSIRRIAALDTLADLVGRATELGKPVHFTAGTGTVTTQAPVMLAALESLGRTAQLTARYNTRLLVTTADPVYQEMCLDTAKTAYSSAGFADRFHPEDVRFLSDTQFAYAAGTIGLIEREKVAGNVLIGQFAAEGLLLAEAGANVNAVQIAGTLNMNILPFFVVACDYTLLGDEIYAAGPYLSKDAGSTFMLAAQDYAKLAVISAIVAGVAALTLGSDSVLKFIQRYGK